MHLRRSRRQKRFKSLYFGRSTDRPFCPRRRGGSLARFNPKLAEEGRPNMTFVIAASDAFFERLQNHVRAQRLYRAAIDRDHSFARTLYASLAAITKVIFGRPSSASFGLNRASDPPRLQRAAGSRLQRAIHNVAFCGRTVACAFQRSTVHLCNSNHDVRCLDNNDCPIANF